LSIVDSPTGISGRWLGLEAVRSYLCRTAQKVNIVLQRNILGQALWIA
jgi:hypothetical protein